MMNNELKIVTNNLNIEEVKQLAECLKQIKGIDYQVIISSNHKNNTFEVEFKEE